MEFLDLIRNAASVTEAMSLLGAYIETLRNIDSIPDLCVRLPIDGYADVYARMFALMAMVNSASQRLDERRCAVGKEALQVFAAAAWYLRPRDSGRR